MTYLFLILGAVCAGIATYAAVLAGRAGRTSTVDRVTTIVDYGMRAVAIPDAPDLSAYLQQEPRQGALGGLATRLGGIFSGRLTAVSEEAIREQLIAAGMHHHRLPHSDDDRDADRGIRTRRCAFAV